MKFAKRRLTIRIFVSVLLVAIGSGAIISYQAAASHIVSSEWSYIDDNYYSVERFTNSNTALLFRRLQEKDYKAIQEKLIDPSIAPNEELIKIAAEDPNAIIPDNVLPDGRFLVSNWESKIDELQKDMLKVYTISKESDGSRSVNEVKSNSPVLSVTFSKQEPLDCKQIDIDGSTVTVPMNLWNGNCGITFLAKEKGLLLTTDDTLTILDPLGNANIISPLTYNNKTFDQISQEALDMYSEQPLFWNGHVRINKENDLIAYVSNKSDVNGTWDLYYLDTSTGIEAKIADDEEFYYFVEQWLDGSHVLCTKAFDSEKEMVVVDIDGKEMNLNFAVD